jgi:hypothetical protein
MRRSTVLSLPSHRVPYDIYKGSGTLAKFVSKNVSDIAMQYDLPYLP